jgi:type IV pilus assembly protein PilM
MAGTQTIWGIDLGRCALKAIKLRGVADDNVEIVAYDYIEHAKILSQPDADRNELISAALEKFLSRNDLSKDQVVVSVSGQHTLSRFTKLPPVAPKRIPDIVRYEADQQIPFDLDEVIWDYQTFQQEGLPDIEVGIFAMKRELIREQLLHFEQAGIEPIAVQSSPLAVYNAVYFDQLLSSETTIVLDVGAENSDLIICTPHNLWTRTVPIGGNAFTEALVKSFKLSFSKAEQLKRTAATSKYARQVFQAMRPVFADLVQELQRSIGFYSSTHRDASVEKVVALGNAFQLPGLQKYLQQNLGIEVAKPDSFRGATGTGSGPDNAIKTQFPSFFTAFGLALQGLDMATVTSNLLPTEIAKQVIWRKKRPAFAAAAACLVLAGGLTWFRQAADMRALASASAGTVPAALDLDQADRIIENGPPMTEPDRVRAQYILAAGSKLQRELNDLGTAGQSERREAEQFLRVLDNRAEIPGLFRLILDSAPQPEGRLAEVTSQEEMLELIKSGAVPPRNQRRQIWLHEIEMHYEPDLKAFDWTSQVTVKPPVNDYTFGGSELPGIRFRVICRTPNRGGAEYVRTAFMEPLLEKGRRSGLGFYVDKAAIVRGGKVQIGTEATGPRGGAGRGRGAVTPTSPTADLGALVPPEQLDPVTLEPMTDDWEFEVWISVILEDFPGGDQPIDEG